MKRGFDLQAAKVELNILSIKMDFKVKKKQKLVYQLVIFFDRRES